MEKRSGQPAAVFFVPNKDKKRFTGGIASVILCV